MNGIINVIKPPGMTSHQVVGFVRRQLKQRRVGHVGTLDPGASGVLVVCVGKATRLSSYLMAGRKTYVAELTLGVATSTQDASGRTEAICTDFSVSPEKLADAFSQFLGDIAQVPPMVSAVRVDGRRLYERERRGEEIHRDPRTVRIYELHINRVLPEKETLTFGSRVLFQVTCGKGTYIRTLCHDIGSVLGVHGHLSFLSRISSDPFSVSAGWTLEEIAEACQTGRHAFLIPMEDGLPNLPRVRVSPLAEMRVLHGNRVPADDLVDVPQALVVGDEVFIMGLEGEVLALARVVRHTSNNLECQPVLVLKEGQPS